jgi:tetrahydromethanopterin S-methyltransferase subunit G
MDQLMKALEEMKTVILSYNDKLGNIEKRLARLEKVDSIEHRVAVNQIDLSDIKDSLEELKENFTFNPNDEFRTIHKRLDSHLIKIGRAEEDILMLKKQQANTSH